MATRIAVDAMGGDEAPAVVVEGALPVALLALAIDRLLGRLELALTPAALR
jgi:ABC-type proline/glycine betaine transport system permease subunit